MNEHVEFIETKKTDLTGYTSTTCADADTMQYIFITETCLDGVCYNLTSYKDVLCEIGCEGNTCKRSLVRETGSFGLWIVILSIIIMFVWLGRRWMR